MEKVKLVDSLSKIDDTLIEDVIDIESIEEYKEKKSKEQYMKINKQIKFLVAGMCAVVTLFVGVLIINNGRKYSDNNEKGIYLVKIANPLVELKNEIEMKKYLGFDVPVLDKKVEAYVVIDIDDDDYADQGRIIYEDGSDFEIAKIKNKDISGIYGASKIGVIKIDDIEVTKYKGDNTYYITWSNGEYSYSYSELKNINTDVIQKIINITK